MISPKFLEIAIKATDYAVSDGSVHGSDEANKRFVQKYAEMLIQECLDICEKGGETQTTSQGAAILIRQRFDI